MSKRFGCRRVVIFGGLITSLGLFLSSFVNSLYCIYLTHGVLVGFGTSISYLPALVMVAYYFDKKRSFATGIATCGSNLGALGLAPLQQVIVDSLGWRNCYRFLSGLALIITICGILFKPLEEKKTGQYKLGQPSEGIEIKSSKQKGLFFPRNKWFIIWAAASTVATFGYFIPHVHLVSSFKVGHLITIWSPVRLTQHCKGKRLVPALEGTRFDGHNMHERESEICNIFPSTSRLLCKFKLR